VPTEEVLREHTITQLGFSRLLAWLDDGVDSHGERYLEMRRRLVGYFDRRDRPAAEELADETLNRIGRTLEEEGVIRTTPPARYCHVVARFVLLEDIRRQRKTVVLDEPRMAAVSRARTTPDVDPEPEIHESRLECLERCLERLQPAKRDLIVEYYRDGRRQGIDRRRSLASRLGITINALSIRACRIRDGLMACVEGCRQKVRRF
jgi:DNA-directed RNA polymerase specialized sigma24 family protein